MAREVRQQTQEEAEERDRIVALAQAKGVTARELARFAGLTGNAGDQRISRWRRGNAVLPPEMTAAMLDGLESVSDVRPADGSDSPDEEITAEALQQRADELRTLAGTTDADEREQLRALSRQHRPEAVGSIVRLMLSARSESVRLKASEIILDRADGRPIQQVLDLTEKAPVEDAELLDMLMRLIAQKLVSRVSAADAGALDGIAAEASALSEDHCDAVMRAIAERRKALADVK